MATAAILGLATALPPYRCDQATIGGWMKEAFAAEPALARWVGLIYAGGGIRARQSVLPELYGLLGRWSPSGEATSSPSTAERMRLYREHAPGLGLAAAQPLVDWLDGAPVEHPSLIAPTGEETVRPGRGAITHLIAVSCTGFYAPGLDLDLVQELGLRPDVKRTLVGFMGCAAGLTGLRLASEIVAGEPEALVLVVSVELCSLHLQATRDREALVGASLFADGAGAALVGRGTPALPGLFGLDAFASHLTPDSATDMAWTVGDTGFNLRLSPYVPEKVAAATPGLVAALLDEEASFWAIHPGGKGILDRLERACGLEPAALEPSRWVLRERGNLSSATIFHVLARWTERLDQPCVGVAAAFGPGLVTELAALRWLGQVAPVGLLAAREGAL